MARGPPLRRAGRRDRARPGTGRHRHRRHDTAPDGARERWRQGFLVSVPLDGFPSPRRNARRAGGHCGTTRRLNDGSSRFDGTAGFGGGTRRSGTGARTRTAGPRHRRPSPARGLHGILRRASRRRQGARACGVHPRRQRERARRHGRPRRLDDLPRRARSLSHARGSGAGRARVEAVLLDLRGRTVSATRTMDWSEEGRRIGATLDAFHAIVVVGTDPVATAETALGIARVQAVHRRVAVGDLLGDAPPIQALVDSDDPHGLLDSFEYGVSLSKVARQVPDSGELFVMPTGIGPVDYEELFGNDRWRRLIAGFREVGALLIIAAPATAPMIHALVDVSDGAVIVGDVVPPEVSVAQSLAWVRPRRGVPSPPSESARAASTDSAPTDIPVVRQEPSRAPRLIAAVVAFLLLAGLAYWGLGAYSERRAVQRATADSAAGVAAARVRVTDSISRLRRDSIARDSVARLGADSFPVFSPANPGDSTAAVGYSILLSKYNTKSGAILDLFGRFSRLPASTYGMETPSRFYLLLAGAFPSRASAESLLVRLRVQGTLARDFGSVDRYPLAFLVDSRSEEHT